MQGKNFKSLGDLMAQKRPQKKAPAYQWQDLALRVIKELSVPGNKRGSIFKVCKDHPKTIIERAMNDTKELCKSGEQWRYFFKVIDILSDPSKATPKATKLPSTIKSDSDLPF